jgi:hypothetical protein
MRFTAGPGIGLLANLDNERPEEYTFTIDGDLNQMAEQMIHLERAGFDVKKSNVYPVLKGSDKKAALTSIYAHRVAGWWHYKKEYAEFGICSNEEFDRELSAQVERERSQREPQ